jgi:hypothetical protein
MNGKLALEFCQLLKWNLVTHVCSGTKRTSLSPSVVQRGYYFVNEKDFQAKLASGVRLFRNLHLVNLERISVTIRGKPYKR